MKIAYLDLAGFRGYRNQLRLDFADGFTIIDGRNGVGKSTIFDAIEFVLTGTVGKYDSAKAGGESVDDYLWWTGEGASPSDRYVEVGFSNGDQTISVRRTQFEEPDAEQIGRITAGLVDLSLAPTGPLQQLCATTIIRDEHIARLSLDLKEADRYALLRDALGANDAEIWIKRAGDLLNAAKKRTAAAQQEVTTVISEVALSARRVDEIRANLIAETAIAEASARLRQFANSDVPPDRLSAPVRQRIANLTSDMATLLQLASQSELIAADRQRLASLSSAVKEATARRAAAEAALSTIQPSSEAVGSSAIAAAAKSVIDLVAMGRKIGLQEGHCPLCAKGQSHDEFFQGMAIAEGVARRLDEAAAREAEREQGRRAAEQELAAATVQLGTANSAQTETLARIASFDDARKKRGIADEATATTIRQQAAELREMLEQAQRDLRVLDTLRFNSELERAQKADADVKSRLARAQDRLGRAQKAEAITQAFHDAARRAAAETLDVRLDRVLPLMSELYQRLRPHPFWKEIEYSIRGDVRRFLKLQVGEDLNPQFIFSSGQRRATGLAFLLSINVSLAWSRWRSLLLDDPVQHIDDFRAVHLAEVAAQLISEGRQIVCAVEDAALADMLCRRLPIAKIGDAKRVTLGVDDQGALSKLDEKPLAPLIQSALVSVAGQSAAS